MTSLKAQVRTGLAVFAGAVTYYVVAPVLPWSTPSLGLALVGIYGMAAAYSTALQIAVDAQQRRRPGGRVAVVVVAGLMPMMTIAAWMLLARHAPQLTHTVLGWCAQHAGALLLGCLLIGAVTASIVQVQPRGRRSRSRRTGAARTAVRS